MKSSINKGFTKEVRHELPLLAIKQDLNFTSTEALAPEARAKIIVRFPRQRELLLPITLAKVSQATRLNTFRDFGINDSS